MWMFVLSRVVLRTPSVRSFSQSFGTWNRKQDFAIPIFWEFVSDCKVGACTGTEISFRLPLESQGLSPLLKALRESQESGWIREYGISSVTLEEVFRQIQSARGSRSKLNSSENNDSSLQAGASNKFSINEFSGRGAPISSNTDYQQFGNDEANSYHIFE